MNATESDQKSIGLLHNMLCGTLTKCSFAILGIFFLVVVLSSVIKRTCVLSSSFVNGRTFLM